MKVIAIIGVVAVVAVGAAGAFMFMGGGDSSDIKYVLDGGTNDPSNPKSYGDDVIYLKDATKDHYEFAGWFSDSGFVNQVTKLSPGGGKITLYAKWTPIQYNVSYVLNKADAVNINPATATYEDEIALKDASQPDYSFAGWYESKDLTESSKVTKLSKTGSDRTLYAKWTSLKGMAIQMYGEESNGSSILMDAKTFSYKGDDVVSSMFIEYTARPNVGSYTLLDYSTSDPDDSGSSDEEFVGVETIDTVDGKKELFVYRSEEGSTWVDGKGIPYRLVTDSITLNLTKHSTFEESQVVTITVFKSDGLTVTGGGSYKLGEKVTLECKNSNFKGYSFDGLLPADGSSKFTFIATESITVFALKDDDYALYVPGEYSNPQWVVKDDMSGLNIASVNSNPAFVSLEENRSFTAKFTGTKDGKTVTEKVDVITGLMFTNNYKWTFEGKQYSLKWTGYLPDYTYYKNMNVNGRHHVDTKTDTQFVTFTDSTIIAFRDYLADQSKNMNELDKADFILRFVQEAIPYKTDASGKDMDEYWKYPYETLYESAGDCEDTSILYAALMKSMGYQAALLLFPGHMATGIGMPSGSGNYGWYWYHTGQTNPVKYYYCETTSTGWWLGDKNDKYDTCTAIMDV